MTSAGTAPTFRVIANGVDATLKVNERLVSITVTDSTGFDSDMLEITLADDEPANPIEIPETGAELEVFLGYDNWTQRMGLFVVDDIELSGWPGEMIIRGRAAPYDKSKGGKTSLQSQKTRSWPKGTKLGDMVKKIASEHGMEPAVSESLAKIPLPHIDQADESDINLLIRIGRKYDATTKPSGGKLVMTKRGEGKTASGEELPAVTLLASDCTAFRMTQSRRESAGTVVAYWHATKNSRRNEIKVGEGEPVRRLKYYFPTDAMALEAAKAELHRRQRGESKVAVSMPGDPSLAAECKLTLAGFRSGIDGDWLINRVTHRIDESGYSCDVEAEKPNDDKTEEVEVSET
ncbi:putative transcriptional regulator [Serratia phage MQ-4]|nr:putative transcriptional regulator [Serratia phage MQ-4]